MKKLAVAIIAVAALASSVRAEVNFDNPKFNLANEISALDLSMPAPAAVNAVTDAKARPDKEWTIMVYINGKNNLEKYAFLNINQMEKVGSTDKVNIVVEFGRMNTYSHLDGTWKGTRRYLIKKGSKPSGIFSPMVSDIGKVDMGDYKNVVDFTNWSKTQYPAKKYMLIIWNHGAGWIKSVQGDKGISYDDETNNHITTPQLGMALKAIGKVDVYGSDACLMQMPEVGYEIKDYTDYIVGSEETEPGDGYTYDTFLGPVVAKPTMDGAELGTIAVDAYVGHYAPSNEGSTQSVISPPR